MTDYRIEVLRSFTMSGKSFKTFRAYKQVGVEHYFVDEYTAPFAASEKEMLVLVVGVV